MNLRHAAALALVGWYLMQPTVFIKPGHQSFDNWGAEISEWTIFSSYDSAQQCEKAKTHLYNNSASKINPSDDPDGTFRASDHASHYATCIATDDPRLKRK
jgi:hypothetical protein